MTQERFQVGRLYFIGGYHDPQRMHPCVIKPVVYVGKEPSTPQRGGDGTFQEYVFEQLESWLERKGQGSPSPETIERTEGPGDMTLVMDISQLIDELNRLRLKLGK